MFILSVACQPHLCFGKDSISLRMIDWPALGKDTRNWPANSSVSERNKRSVSLHRVTRLNQTYIRYEVIMKCSRTPQKDNHRIKGILAEMKSKDNHLLVRCAHSIPATFLMKAAISSFSMVPLPSLSNSLKVSSKSWSSMLALSFISERVFLTKALVSSLSR